MRYDCLFIDDDVDIAENTAEYFNMFDVSTIYATSYEEGLQLLTIHDIGLLLLDINLGDASGFELCKQIRKTSEVPIFFISARTSDIDILTALNIGGDDYIKKPYQVNILLAKAKAVLNRYEKMKEKIELRTDTVVNIQCGDMKIDDNYHMVIKKGKPVKLKEMEFQLFRYLAKNKNRVISKDELLDKVWNSTFVGEGTLTVHIRHLREKLEEIPNEPKYIKTVWGVGYVIEDIE